MDASFDTQFEPTTEDQIEHSVADALFSLRNELLEQYGADAIPSDDATQKLARALAARATQEMLGFLLPADSR